MAVTAEPAGGIGGDPGAVEGAAGRITTAAATMTTAGQDVGTHGDAVVARWTGSASQAAHERIRHLSDRIDVGAEVVGELPKILTDYAAELRQAQADHAAGVTAAQAAGTALSSARTAMVAAQAMDDGPDRASATRLSGQSQRYAEEGVAAAAHTIDAAIARERTANTVAADAVRALTTRLAGMDPRPPGAIPPVSVRAVEAAEGYEDQGPPPAWIERAAQTAVDAASGAMDTAYIVPQGFGYLVLRNMGYSHEQAIARLESDHEKLLAASGADTDSAVRVLRPARRRRRGQRRHRRRGRARGRGRRRRGGVARRSWSDLRVRPRQPRPRGAGPRLEPGHHPRPAGGRVGHPDRHPAVPAGASCWGTSPPSWPDPER